MASGGEIDLFHHVRDGTRIEIFETIGFGFDLIKPEQIPSFLQPLFPNGFTKYMLLELIAAVLVAFLVIPVCRRLRNGDVPRGRWANMVEGLLLFIRDEVARASIPDKHDHHGHDEHGHGHSHEAHHHTKDSNAPPHRADYYLPLLWTLFLFIVTCNLLGMLPFCGSPTASLAVTGVLSLITFIVIHAAGIMNNGLGGYAKSFVPKIEGDDAIMKILGPMITVGVTAIEVMSLFIRNIVLAVRLFANMVGGHTALYLMMLFIVMAGTTANPAGPYIFWPVTVGSTLLVIAMSVLELFVALLQAYVFTMLTATFIGLSVSPEH